MNYIFFITGLSQGQRQWNNQYMLVFWLILFHYERILLPDVVGEKLRHEVGGELGDVEYEVVVAGIVTRHASDSLRVGVASLVDFIDAHAGSVLVQGELFHDAFHTGFPVGDEEDSHGIRMVSEDMESGTPDDDARLL